jgi:sterol desaturase/sphingolipid hydroxylase (fatty acid hydroxylase superfamily)
VDGVDTQTGQHTGLLKEAIRRCLVLVALAGPLLAACWWVRDQRPLGGLTLAVYIAVAGVLILCEHWLAFDRGWGSAIRGSKTDFLYVIVASALEKVSFILCVTAIAALGRWLATHFEINLWPSHWSLGFQVVLALFIADAGAYVRHRLSHASSALWRLHQIHHSMTELYWIRSAYTHPLEQLFIMLAIMLPISLLGAGNDVVAVVAFVFGLSGLLQHANIDTRSSVLNYVFATPEVHRMHHGADERGNNSNFSAFFVFMDILFGTYDRPAQSPAPLRVGLADVTAFPKDFLSHLALPFRRDPADSGAWGRSPTEVAAANEP